MITKEVAQAAKIAFQLKMSQEGRGYLSIGVVQSPDWKIVARTCVWQDKALIEKFIDVKVADSTVRVPVEVLIDPSSVPSSLKRRRRERA